MCALHVVYALCMPDVTCTKVRDLLTYMQILVYQPTATRRNGGAEIHMKGHVLN